LWRRRKNPVFSFGVLLFFAGLAPVANIVPIRTIINERFLYLPLLGFALVAAEFISRPSGRRWRLGLASVALLASTALTALRTREWRDDFTLLQATLKTCPQSARAHYGMAHAYSARGEWKEARAEIQTALAVDPAYYEELARLGILKDEKLDEAVAGYRETMQVRIEYAPALFLLGTADLRMGDFDEAARVLEAALKAAPERVDINANLAAAYAGLGRLEEAVSLSRRIVAGHPEEAKARTNLALYERLSAQRSQTAGVSADELRTQFPSLSQKWAGLGGREFERTSRGISPKLGAG
jgi:tetratricopeptide (TPR) repeat protein